MKKTLVIGAAILDIILEIPHLPHKGEDVYATEQTMAVGGCAYNVASILKNFNTPYDLFAPVGNGTYGSIVEKTLQDHGHNIVIKSDRIDNGYCLCLVDETGERTFITYPGIECQFEAEWFNSIDPLEYHQVYVSGYELEGVGGDAILTFLEQNSHLSIYFAPGPRIAYIAEDRLARMMNLKPLIHLNDTEAIEYIGNNDLEYCAKTFSSQTQGPVIITLGPRGVLLFENNLAQYIEGVPAKVIDTIGAGDSHIGSILAMQSKGLSLARSCQVANHVAAKVVSIKGSILSQEIFDREQFI